MKPLEPKSLLRAALCLVFVMAARVASAAGYLPDPDTYAISFAGRGSSETILISVSCPAESPATAVADASACALHGIMFRGLSATATSPSERPLVTKPLTSEQQAWVDDFFASGRFKSFVPNHSQGSLRIARQKKSYSVTVTVSVDKRGARKALESAGIIERLGGNF